MRKIFGRGESPLASCSGNGCYVLEKISDSEWLLHLHPSQRYLADPQRGRQFRHMANRWISCLKEPPISQLKEDMLEFRFSLGTWRGVQALSGRSDGIVVLDDHSARLEPGDYLIVLEQGEK